MARKNNKPEHRINRIDLAKYVVKVQKGNKKALEHIVNETGDYIYYYCITLLRNEDEASEAVQDIYVILLEKLKTLENPQTFLGWLKVITSNYCKNRLSRKPHTISIEESEITEFTEDKDSQIMPEKCLETEEISGIIMSVVKQLPDIHKECVLMYYYHQLSIEQIATVLEVKEGTVKSRLYHARKAIKAELEKYGKENLTFNGFSPLLYITGSLLSESENYRFTVPSQNIISAKSVIHTENAIGTDATLSSAVKLIPVTVAKASIAAKVIAGIGIVTAGTIVTGSVVTHTIKNSDTKPVAVVEQNTKVNPTEPSSHDTMETLYYANGLTDEDRRTKVVYNEEEELNSENNKNYIYDLMSNAIDNYKSLQGTYYCAYDSEFNSTCYYSSYFFTFEEGGVSKEITYDCEGTPISRYICNGRLGKSIPYYESADSTKISPFEESICEEIRNERDKTLTDETKDFASKLINKNSNYENSRKSDFVSLIDSRKRQGKIIDGQEMGFLRTDYANLATSKEQYFPQTLACNLLYNFDKWKITDDSSTVKYVPDRKCFAISGVSDGFNDIYSFEMFVDKETGALIYFIGKDINGEENNALITYEFTVDGKIDEAVIADIDSMFDNGESDIYASED